MIIKFKKNINSIIKIIKKPVMSILPGQLAFSFVLTIIPAIALIAVISATLSISLDSIANFISDSFPSAVSGLLLPLINGRGFDLSILFFLLGAFWLASTGSYSIITASDIIYELKPQNNLSKRIKSFIMTILLIILILFMLIVPAFGDFLIKFIANLKVFSNITNEIMFIYYLLKYPLSFLLIYFNLKIIYTIAPNVDIKSKSVTNGSLFTTLIWMLTTQIYSYWVGNIAHYDLFYGSISNIIILLIWVYLLSYIFVIGLVMNANVYKNNLNND